jgi:predicted peptidase
MCLRPFAALVLACQVFFSGGSVLAADRNDFLDFSTADLPGRLYVPPEAENSARPLIVFLHGAGESGTNNLSQINSNIDNLLKAAKQRGAFLYAPQATTVVGSIYNWNDTSRTTNVMAKVDQVLAEQNADPDRVYITGLSMGGGGTWNMVSRYPDRFAAAVPIAGVKTADDFAPANQLGTPTWAFHARNDGVVSKDRSREVINGMLLAAGEPTLTFPANNDRETTFEFVSEPLDLRYTEFPTGDHFIWGRVYDTPEMYDWMFSHAVPEPACGTMLILGAVILAMVVRRAK